MRGKAYLVSVLLSLILVAPSVPAREEHAAPPGREPGRTPLPLPDPDAALGVESEPSPSPIFYLQGRRPLDWEYHDHFGARLAISGDTLAVSSLPDGSSVNANSVYIYSIEPWQLRAKFQVGSAPGDDAYAESIDASGSTVVVSARLDDDLGAGAGAAYVYHDPGSGWVQAAKLTASDGAAGDGFGTDVAIDGDRIAVGAPYVDGSSLTDVGAVYIFEWDGSAWTEMDKVMAEDETTVHHLGVMIDISGDTLITSGSGTVVFVFDGVGWIEEDRLPRNGDIAVSGDTIALGDWRDGYPPLAYHRDASIWSEEAQMYAIDGFAYDYYGWPVDVSGAFFVTAGTEIFWDPPLPNKGSGFIFERTDSGWIERARIRRPDGQGEWMDGFGERIVTDGQRVVMSAPLGPYPSWNGYGWIYVFNLSSMPPPNQTPVAACRDVVASAAAPGCDAVVSIDDGSVDPDGDPLIFTQVPPAPYSLGDTLVSLTVEDPNGAWDSCQGMVTVVDDVGPVVTLAADPPVLWPPNHRMVAVGLSGAATDNCDPAPGLTLLSVSSSEPEDAPGYGDGETTDDVQGFVPGPPPRDLLLRAERDGEGPGRSYAISYSSSDNLGNISTGQILVTVPHDQGGIVEHVIAEIIGDELVWTAAPGAVSYDLLRGEIPGIWSAGSLTMLDNVRCLDDDNPGTSHTSGHFRKDPAPGSAYVYLLQYDDGVPRGYGTASARGEITIASGSPCP